VAKDGMKYYMQVNQELQDKLIILESEIMLHDFSVKEIKDLNVYLLNENDKLKQDLDRAHQETINQRE
jgi:hypothetical protein